MNVSTSGARQRMQRGRAHRRPLRRHQVDQQIDRVGAAQLRQRGDRLELQVLVDFRRHDQPPHHRAAARVAEQRTRARPGCARRAARRRCRRSPAAARRPRCILDWPEAARGKRARQLPVAVEQLEQRRRRARIVDALERIRDRPPAAARPAVAIEHGAGQRVVRAEPHQRVQRQGARPRPPAPSDAPMSSGVDAVERAGVDVRASTIAAIAGAAALCPIRPSASAARPCISGSASLSAVVSAGAAAASPIRPIANAAICRTSGSASDLQHRRSARARLGQLDAADRERRAAPDARLGVRQQRDQVAAAGPRSCALVFELQDPAHLLLEHRRRRRRRRPAAREPGPQPVDQATQATDGRDEATFWS